MDFDVIRHPVLCASKWSSKSLAARSMCLHTDFEVADAVFHVSDVEFEVTRRPFHVTHIDLDVPDMEIDVGDMDAFLTHFLVGSGLAEVLDPGVNKAETSRSVKRLSLLLLLVGALIPGCSSNHPGTGATATESPAASASPTPALTTIRVHYPAGSQTVTLRGSNAPYNWNSGVPLTAGANDTWTLAASDISAPFQFKPLLDDATWSQGPNYRVNPGQTVDLYPHFTATAGSWSVAFQWTSTILSTTRGIYVYLPPSYAENTDARFPVVYMHDGQNLFDPAASFGGVVWAINTAMDDGAADGSIAEAIVIGIDNDANRIAEYTPVVDPTTPSGDGAIGAQYLQAIIQELKPLVDSTYRTLPDRANTSMMGSSLGGLITSYAGVEASSVFGAVGILSPSTWWDSNWIIGEVATIPTRAPGTIRVYLDSGNAGTDNDDVTLTAQLAAEYGTVGYVQGTTLDYLVQDGGQHSETYWAERAPGALSFTVGARELLP